MSNGFAHKIVKYDKSRMIFLFPGDYFNYKKVDDMYLDEMTSLQQAGFTTATISIESLSSPIPKVSEILSPKTEVIYRGWMLTPSDYQLLVREIERLGTTAYISVANYLATHYLPNWYHSIADLTPETKFYPCDDRLESELNILGWEKFFIKDYVKSLKTSLGAIIDRPSEIGAVIAEMEKFRGTIEGGICVRRVEYFIPESERRYLVINGKPFAANETENIPKIVEKCANRIESKFFSIDIIDRRDGVQRVVEIGDGQVSGLVGWSTARFAQIWITTAKILREM